MKNVFLSATILLISSLYLGCSDDDDDNTGLRQVSVTWQTALKPPVNLSGEDTFSNTNRGFINLYDGRAYNYTDAIANANKIDFAYILGSTSCLNCRYLQDMQSLNGFYAFGNTFSLYTTAKLAFVSVPGGVTSNMFDQIRTEDDVLTLFNTLNIDSKLTTLIDISAGSPDIQNAIDNIIAFEDRAGRKGFFRITNDIACSPPACTGELQLVVKMTQR